MSRALKEALIRKRQAEQNVLTTLRREYPIGSPVKWMRGRKVHQAIVSAHDKFDPAIWANNYKISASEIVGDRP